MKFTSLTFLNISAYFAIVLLVIFLLYFYIKSHRKLEKKYPLLLQSDTSTYKLLLLGISIIILCLTILGPSITTKQENQVVQGNDVLIVLDVSKSMNAYDIKGNNTLYSRIEVAKSYISDIVLASPKNRYGLVIFAGEAVSVSPLTSDLQIFLNFLKSVNFKNINSQGTNLEEAYAIGLQRFLKNEEISKGNMLLLFSDGGDTDDITDIGKIKDLFSKSDLEHAVIGVGTNEGERLIDGRNIFGEIKYQQYKGKDVITKLNETKLKEIASINNGDYYKISEINSDADIQKIFKNIEKKSIKRSGEKHQKDISRFLTILVFVFFLLMITHGVFTKK